MRIAIRRPILVISAALCLMTTVHAAEPQSHNFVVNVWEENHFGGLILAGKAQSAIAEFATLQRDLRVKDNLHLCAAQLKLGLVNQATLACEAAASRARQRSANSSAGKDSYRLQYAMAANNAGVMYALKGDVELARRAFQRALRAKPWHDSARSNLALLEARSPLH